MDNRLKPYDEYKKTEYEWIGDIPIHWNCLLLSQTCSEQKIKNTENIEKKVLSLSYGNIIIKKNMYFGLVPKDYENYQIVTSGNIILRLTDLQNDHVSLRTGLVKQTGIITAAYTCLKPFQNPKYLQLLLHSFDTQKVFYGLGGGVRQSIGYKDIRNMRVPLPPREEQDQIVKYLDWKLSKINKFIKAKKKQIELLKEQKHVIFNQVITKGLDNDVPTKENEIDWIDGIPISWRKDKVTRLFGLIGSGTTPSSDNISYYEDGTIPWVNSGDLYSESKFLSIASKNVTNKAITEYSVLKIYPVNSIVIAMYGASIGNLAIIKIPSCCNQACCCLSEIDQRLEIDYAYYLFKVCKSTLIEKSKGGGQSNISQEIIKQTWLPLPPKEEQIVISQYLDKQEEKFQKMITSINSEIDLLHEYRTSLISDVVTGKVDVRNIVIEGFSDEDNEPDEIDESGEEASDAEELDMEGV